MIKRRMGEDFATKLGANLEIKSAEVAKKEARGGRRRPRENREGRERGERGERKPRENKEEKKDGKAE